MRSKILIILIVIISFASAHDLFINHFEPTKSTLSNTTTTLHGDIQCETSKNSLHHSLHADAISSDESFFETMTTMTRTTTSRNTLSYNLKPKQIKPPIV